MPREGEPVAFHQSADEVYSEYLYANQHQFIKDLEVEEYDPEKLEELRRTYENEYLLLAPVSQGVHHQGSQPVCYSFCVATLLRATLRRVGREGEIGSHAEVVEQIQTAVQNGLLDTSQGSTVGALNWAVQAYPGLVMREVKAFPEVVGILRSGERSLAMSFGLSVAEWSAFRKFFRDSSTTRMTLKKETLDEMVAAGEKGKCGGGAGSRHSVVATAFEGDTVRFKNSWGGQMGIEGSFHIQYSAMTEVRFWDLVGAEEA